MPINFLSLRDCIIVIDTSFKYNLLPLILFLFSHILLCSKIIKNSLLNVSYSNWPLHGLFYNLFF